MTLIDETQAPDADERKRLGQYFTGQPLARVLAALAHAELADTVIDPMAGSGDMLVAARAVGGSRPSLTGIEIDPLAATLCSDRLRSDPSAEVFVGDAFSPETWAGATSRSWDLVIANPPYVRYQRAARGASGRVEVPSASKVRAGLARVLSERTALDTDDRLAFETMAANYSGLADLAVPAWILCASLVSPGGRLAIVVPDTWLSRDYATPVAYLLQRYFQIEAVVEDGDAGWFTDALVRTTLVVARRVVDSGSLLHSDTTGYVHARLDSCAATPGLPIGALFGGSPEPEKSLARALQGIARSRVPLQLDGLSAVWVDGEAVKGQVATEVGRISWMSGLEPSRPSSRIQQTLVPAALSRHIQGIVGEATLRICTIADYGWKAGQGLRTGANRFFYGECLHGDGTETLLRVDPAFGAEPIVVPTELLRPAIRKQRDLALADGAGHRSHGRLLDLGGWALPEDLASAATSGWWPTYRTLPEPLAGHIRRAARLNVGTADAPRLLPDLSAVATNVRPFDPNRPSRPPRFWYQLPPLAPRHVPQLFIPRVNHGHPVTRPNHNDVVVDANFSTLWTDDDRAISPAALGALLNSSWTVLAMETLGTTLGGGALKLEATQLRRLTLPLLTPDHLAKLEALCATTEVQLVGGEIREQVDAIVWQSLLARAGEPGETRKALELLRANLLGARNRRTVG